MAYLALALAASCLFRFCQSPPLAGQNQKSQLPDIGLAFSAVELANLLTARVEIPGATVLEFALAFALWNKLLHRMMEEQIIHKV